MRHYAFSPGTTAVGCAIAAILWSASPAHGQDTLQQIKALYASAAYEDVLTLLGRQPSGEPAPELEQYRVFCLIALGRIPEAERAISSVVVQNPTFWPNAAEAPPRIREMFSRIRRTLVPEIAQRLYVEARASFDRKDRLAESQFEALVRLIDSTPHLSPTGEDEEPMLTELRLLAAGFLDLSRALRATPAASAPIASEAWQGSFSLAIKCVRNPYAPCKRLDTVTGQEDHRGRSEASVGSLDRRIRFRSRNVAPSSAA
jgi:hypothetical protein